MNKNKPPVAVIAGLAAGLLVYGLIGYFLFISPQSGKAADLKKQAEATQAQITQYRTLAAQARATPPIRVAELFRLTKAMPDNVDMAGLLLELSEVARESGIEFDSITPQAPAQGAGFQNMQITLEFDGNYYELSDFLFRLRNLVRVRSGLLDARGRLFVVDSISFSESTHSFPRIKASLVVHAFVYGTAPIPGAPTQPPPASTGTTSTSTTTTTTPSPNTPPGGSATPAP